MTQIIKYFIFGSCHVFFFSVYSDRTDMPMIFFTSVAGVILHLLNYLRKRNTPILSYFLYCTASGLMSPVIIQRVDFFGFQPIHILMLVLYVISLVLVVLTAPESKKI